MQCACTFFIFIYYFLPHTIHTNTKAAKTPVAELLGTLHPQVLSPLGSRYLKLNSHNNIHSLDRKNQSNEIKFQMLPTKFKRSWPKMLLKCRANT